MLVFVQIIAYLFYMRLQSIYILQTLLPNYVLPILIFGANCWRWNSRYIKKMSLRKSAKWLLIHENGSFITFQSYLFSNNSQVHHRADEVIRALETLILLHNGKEVHNAMRTHFNTKQFMVSKPSYSWERHSIDIMVTKFRRALDSHSNRWMDRKLECRLWAA